MRNPTPYLKMRVLGAIDMAEGNSIQARIRAVSQMTFTDEANDELFFVEEERHVRADNTFSFKSLRFEAPRHLPDRTIHLRFRRSSPAERVIVYYKGERMGQARLLDPIANDRKPTAASATLNPQTAAEI